MSVAFFRSGSRPAAAVIVGVVLAALFTATPTAASADDAANATSVVDETTGLTLAISGSTKGFAAGQEITVSYTVKNSTNATISVPSGTEVVARVSAQTAEVSGTCVGDGWGSWAEWYFHDTNFALPVSIAAGRSFTCGWVFTASAADVARGGIWAALFSQRNGDPNLPPKPTGDYAFYGRTATAAPSGPTISGASAVGSTLTASTGFFGWWKDSFDYQWLRGGTKITGATASTYAVTAADAGAAISVRVVGHADNADGSWLTLTSAATASVKAGTLASAVPTISGSFAVASTLTAKPGAWTSGTAFTYQWLRSGVKISGATASTYKLTTADAGKQISVIATGAKSGYSTLAKTSAKSAKVATATTPKITGAVKVGSTLTATTGTWTAKTAFGYQWLRDGKVISGATKATYVLTAADAGKKITVALTGTLAGHATVTKTSGATAAVANGVLTAPVPKLTGTVKVGSTLTATAGTWTGGTTVKYQWLRNGSAISGATSKTYALRPSDAYATITVKTTGTKSGYTTAAKTSAATAAVAGKVYANCTLLNADYPDGIRKAGVTKDKKSGVLKPLVGNPYSSTALYNLQSIARDADRDGIMCER